MTSAVAYYRVSTQRQGRSGLGIEAQRAAVARFAESRGHHHPARVHRGRDRQGRRCARPTTAAGRSARHCSPGKMPGRGGQARSPLARRRLHCRPDGAARAVHRGGTRRRCRPVHAAPLCRAGREGTPADLGAHQGRPRLSQSCRARSSAIPPMLAKQRRQDVSVQIRTADSFAETIMPIIAALQKVRRHQPERHRNRPERPWRSNGARRRVAGVERAQCPGESGNADCTGRFIGGN